MSSPYPPSAPKKLYRSRSKRMIAGVCGGLADYLNMDPTLVRILTVVISLFTGIPVVLYIVALFVVPEEPAPFPPQGYPPVNGPQGYDNPYAAPAPGAPYGNAGVRPAAGAAGRPGLGSGRGAVGAGLGRQHDAEPAPSPEPAPTPPPAEPVAAAEPGAAEPAPPAEPEPSPEPQPEPGRAGARGRRRGVVRGTRSPGGVRRGPAQELTL